MEKKRVPKLAVGCYGGRRGSTIAALINARLKQKLGDNYQERVQVYGVGHPEFVKGGAIPTEHQEALKEIAEENPCVKCALEQLRTGERRAISPEEIEEADEVYAADTFIRDKYRELHKGEGQHVTTIAEASGIYHGIYGPDLDDTEMPLHYVIEVIVPKKQGKKLSKNAPSSPREANWHSLEGRVYKAGTREARVQEAKDMVTLSDYLANYIIKRYVKK